MNLQLIERYKMPYSVLLPKSVHRRLTDLAKRTGIQKADLVREAVALFLASAESMERLKADGV